MAGVEPGPVTTEEVEAWRGWIGCSERRPQVLDPETLRRFAAALGADLEVERSQPPLAHWAYFMDVAGPEGIEADGHVRRGALLPPVRLPRRMFAAATLRVHGPLALGREAELILTVADVRHRPGQSGDLVFVEVDRRLVQDGRDLVEERQTLVYRASGAPTPPVETVAAVEAPGVEVWTPGSVDLFRFSAATFNAHRIHYDLPYAKDVEGYPDLVVHGPFTAAKLFAFARALAGGRPLRRFAFRAAVPLFAGQPVRLERGRLERGPAQDAVQAVRCDGALAMTAHWEA